MIKLLLIVAAVVVGAALASGGEVNQTNHITVPEGYNVP